MAINLLRPDKLRSPVMSRAVVLLALLAGACTPTFNWREMAVSPANLHTTFPCKPDQAEHKAAILPGREVVLHAMGCETGGATFIVVYADLGSEADLTDAIVEWKKASLASTKSGVDREQPYLPAHALGLSQSVMVRARGQRADGSAVQSQAAYFARGTSVFQAVVYARALKPEMTEPFFTGLRFE